MLKFFIHRFFQDCKIQRKVTLYINNKITIVMWVYAFFQSIVLLVFFIVLVMLTIMGVHTLLYPIWNNSFYITSLRINDYCYYNVYYFIVCLFQRLVKIFLIQIWFLSKNMFKLQKVCIGKSGEKISFKILILCIKY